MADRRRARGARGPAGFAGVLREALRWAPVWLPLALFAQVAILGLRPALAEERHLEAQEVEVRARYERAVERRDELQRILRAQADPMYEARWRKMFQADEPEPPEPRDR